VIVSLVGEVVRKSDLFHSHEGYSKKQYLFHWSGGCLEQRWLCNVVCIISFINLFY